MLDHLSRCFENSGREILELHDSTVHECLISCLQHLHIFRPQSSGALIATLESVPTYLFDQDRHYSSTKHLQVVVLDSLSAFLWQDRIDEDRKRLDIASTIATTYQTDSTFLQKYHHLVERLTHIQRTFDCAILTSSWSLSSVARTADGPSVRPHLPAIWNNFCAVQIVVERDIIAKFELSISAEEALREGPQRLKAVQENRFKARLNHWGVDGWSDEILQKMRGLGKDREFSFQTVQNGFRLIQP
ncbi:hypothetical protein MMC06_002316 [Schaereria dolodes]|nr:hypothetical protein [Schaereria dolodes]